MASNSPFGSPSKFPLNSPSTSPTEDVAGGVNLIDQHKIKAPKPSADPNPVVPKPTQTQSAAASPTAAETISTKLQAATTQLATVEPSPAKTKQPIEAQSANHRVIKPSAIPKLAAPKRNKTQSATVQPAPVKPATTKTKRSVKKQDDKSNPAQSQTDRGYPGGIAFQVQKEITPEVARRNRQQHHTKLQSARLVRETDARQQAALEAAKDTPVALGAGEGSQMKMYDFVLQEFPAPEGKKTTARRAKLSSSPKEPALFTSGEKPSTSKQGRAAPSKRLRRTIPQIGSATGNSSVVHSGVSLKRRLPSGPTAPTFLRPRSDLLIQMPIPGHVHGASHTDRDETGQRMSKNLRLSPERDFTDTDNQVIADFNSSDPQKLVASSIKISPFKRATDTQKVDGAGVAGPSKRPVSPFKPYHSDTALPPTNGGSSNIQFSAEDWTGASAIPDAIRGSTLLSSSPTQCESTNDALDLNSEYVHREFRLALATAIAQDSASQAQREENGIFTHQGAVESTDSLATGGSGSSFGPSTPPDRIFPELPQVTAPKDKKGAAASPESVNSFP